MNWFPEPRLSEAEICSEAPAGCRDSGPTEWSTANRYGDAIESFLKGPSFNRDGALYVTDIPHGRVFRVSRERSWTLVSQFDGWPNGLKIDSDGRIFIADRKQGLIELDPSTGKMSPHRGSLRTEGFKRLNDLHIALIGNIYMTDQGQTGPQEPSGRIYRLTTDGRLECLLTIGVSPNGIVVTPDEQVMFVAMTRSSQIWRVPISGDAIMAKANLFCQRPVVSGDWTHTVYRHVASCGRVPGGLSASASEDVTIRSSS
ncbi:SMP-30/gluconolactonase/LRE family protein [Roseibium album]|uniref:SMP-30/gluconolactonase/LRE family protein n=1 Tax=Roseibium album TaxID=311410 RepID=UPI00329972A2